MLFLKALLMGLAIAAPLGPIGALCIQRTLAHGFRAGMAGGLGTALADACYAAAAAAGFAAFAAVLDRIQLPLGIGGGLFLIWLGLKGLTTEQPSAAAAAAPRGLWSTLAATFLLTLANPATILSFAAIFAGLGLAREADLTSGVTVVAGVFAGSMLWWILLAGGVALAQRHLPRTFATSVARASGALMLAFGLWALAAAFG
ncbi:LysE family translocator [Cereibacter sphaeroides]|uniref:LysE family translocator n=1 Tax=Cereibacter sphaeroides TaxID=1063 RepID=UPI000E5AF483|nr:LysE family transporter [Cereibacter sphaeroides]RIA00681.1 LysE family translocator [Cereibacter sphaeroides]